MAKLKIYNDIVDEEEKIRLQGWMGLDGVCFKDINDFVHNIPEDDSTIDIRLHCRGGSCMEGWAIYDALRTSGKEITATVDGECSSMATIILLAAPKERRFGQKNASICIHNPHIPFYDLYDGENLTADDVDALAAKAKVQADSLREEQQKIVDLYVERTGTDAETLQALMNEDKYINMDKAIELGFISETLAPNTDSKSKTNKKNMSKVTVDASIFNKMLQKLGLKKAEDLKIVDQVITTADGQELTVEREDGDPQEGDAASPDGEFVMDDGTKITVQDGVITSISESANTEEEDSKEEEANAEDKNEGESVEGKTEDEKPEGKTEEDDDDDPDEGGEDDDDDPDEKHRGEASEEVEALKSENAELKAKVESLENESKALKDENESLKASAKTDEENAILDKVNSLGGMKWLDLAGKASSTFTPENRKFVERKHVEEDEPSQPFASFLEAKRAKRIH